MVAKASQAQLGRTARGDNDKANVPASNVKQEEGGSRPRGPAESGDVRRQGRRWRRKPRLSHGTEAPGTAVAGMQPGSCSEIR